MEKNYEEYLKKSIDDIKSKNNYSNVNEWLDVARKYGFTDKDLLAFAIKERLDLRVFYNTLYRRIHKALDEMIGIENAEQVVKEVMVNYASQEYDSLEKEIEKAVEDRVQIRGNIERLKNDKMIQHRQNVSTGKFKIARKNNISTEQIKVMRSLGMTIEKIANTLGISSGTVRNRLKE